MAALDDATLTIVTEVTTTTTIYDADGTVLSQHIEHEVTEDKQVYTFSAQFHSGFSK